MIRDFFAPLARKIEAKVAIRSEADLEIIRLQHAPVLGKDPAFAVAIYYAWRFLIVHLLTPAFLWVTAATWCAVWAMRSALAAATLDEKISDLVWWFGAHCMLSWVYFAARPQAREILGAIAHRIREGIFGSSTARAPKPNNAEEIGK
jgi:hypothetical protein